MARRRPVAYISGPLQAAVDLDSARSFYALLAAAADRAGAEPYLPHLHADPVLHRDSSNLAVFHRDYEQLLGAALVIADVGQPSSGVGAELGIANERGIPVIAVHRHLERPSRFVAGMLDESRTPVLLYEDRQQCSQLVEEAARALLRAGGASLPTAKRSAA